MFEAKKLKARRRWDSVSIDEIRQFIGSKAPSFLPTAENLRAQALYGKKIRRSWCWSAFVFTFAWFAYRKMYAVSAAFLLVPLLAGVAAQFYEFELPSSFGVAISVVCGHFAKQIYVLRAQSVIFDLREKGILDDARLGKAGGVSKLAGVLAGLLWLLFVLLASAPLIVRFLASPSETAIA